MNPWKCKEVIGGATLYCGDAREVMKYLIAEGVKVQMCVTSPPYWGLRDYGTAKWEGGDAECNHFMPPLGGTAKSTLCLSVDGDGFSTGKTQPNKAQYKQICGKCGAHRIDSQLGLESTPEEYVVNMVEVFRLVRELLTDDGTLWLNLGDSYYGSWGNSGQRPELDGKSDGQRDKNCEYLPRGGWDNRRERPASSYRHPTLKPKDLVGIPWRVAFALQADGWYLRQDIIWSKPNPMPESVTDRCTKSHEYLFLLSKEERYYYDADAIAEPQADISVRRAFSTNNVDQRKDAAQDVYAISGTSQDKTYAKMRESIAAGEPQTRNKRSVWTITTKPFRGAHFATFPPDLIEPCILAGSRTGDIVFDPFIGSGTTAEVCIELGRKCIGIDLNDEYLGLRAERIENAQRQVRLFPESVEKPEQLALD